MRSKRGINSIIAALILIMVTVCGGLIMYSLFVSTTGPASTGAQVSFSSLDLYRRTDGDVDLATTLKNSGNRPVNIVNVVVKGPPSALLFDGIDDYVSIVSSPSLNITGALTLETWVKFKKINTATNLSLIRKEEAYALDLVPMPAGSYQPFGAVWINGSRVEISAGYTNYLRETGRWYHLVFTYNGSLLRFFINGQAVKVALTSGSVQYNNDPITLGKHGLGVLNGSMDNVRIYQRALTPEEVVSRYNGNDVNHTGLALDISFDGTTQDSSPFENTVTVVGPTFTGEINYSISKMVEPGKTIGITSAERAASPPITNFAVGNKYTIIVQVSCLDGSSTVIIDVTTCK